MHKTVCAVKVVCMFSIYLYEKLSLKSFHAFKFLLCSSHYVRIFFTLLRLPLAICFSFFFLEINGMPEMANTSSCRWTWCLLYFLPKV